MIVLLYQKLVYFENKIYLSLENYFDFYDEELTYLNLCIDPVVLRGISQKINDIKQDVSVDSEEWEANVLWNGWLKEFVTSRNPKFKTEEEYFQFLSKHVLYEPDLFEKIFEIDYNDFINNKPKTDIVGTPPSVFYL